MVFKFAGEAIEFGVSMIVTDGLARRFPDMLLGIEIRGSGWKKENFKLRMGGEKGFECGSLMPFGSIPQEQNRLVRISDQQFL